MAKHALESENKLIKKIALIVLAIIIVMGIVAIVYYHINLERSKKAINDAFSSLKYYNINKANQYIDYKEVLYSLDEILIDEKNENVERELFNSIEWKIDKVEINGDNATAIVEVTNKNFIKVVTSWMKIIVAEKDKGKKITNKLSLEHLEKILSEMEDTKSEINKIDLEKKNNVWKIKVTEQFRNLIYPGIDIVSTVLENDVIK